MRRFYDRYGPEGIDWMPPEKYGAGSFHDDELSVIVAEEDRFAYMQRKMSSLMRDHEEIRVQRLQSLSGTCSMAARSDLLPLLLLSGDGRALQPQYTAISHHMKLDLTEDLSLMLSASGHIQGDTAGVITTGLGIAHAATSRWRWQIMGRVKGVMQWPDIDLGSTYGVSPTCTAGVDLQLRRRGADVTCSVNQKLPGAVSASTAVTAGANPGLRVSVGGVEWLPRCTARMAVGLKNESADATCRLTFRHSEALSLLVEPSVAVDTGAGLALTVLARVFDSHSRLHWSLRLSRGSSNVALKFVRHQFTWELPIELTAPADRSTWFLAVVAALFCAPVAGGILVKRAKNGQRNQEVTVVRKVSGSVVTVSPGGQVRSDRLMYCRGAGVPIAELKHRNWYCVTWLSGTQFVIKDPDGGFPMSLSGGDNTSRFVSVRNAVEHQSAARSASSWWERLASGRRATESSSEDGLVIIAARIGNALEVASDGHDRPDVLDVSTQIQAMVRGGRLQLSSASKRSLLGLVFEDDTRFDVALWVKYRCRGAVSEVTVSDSQPLSLP
mmetsp:Transcript_57303/g.153134  ORF Transcript_57303/g.153134 Transcript_57303/m.153134 type:complete len:555 (-) Transcript_57303:8-1672(-)